MKVREIDARSWLIKYVKAKHNLPNYDKAVRFAKSVNYIDENADVTETGRYCSNLVSSTEITCQKTKNYCSHLYNAEPAVACKL